MVAAFLLYGIDHIIECTKFWEIIECSEPSQDSAMDCKNLYDDERWNLDKNWMSTSSHQTYWARLNFKSFQRVEALRILQARLPGQEAKKVDVSLTFSDNKSYDFQIESDWHRFNLTQDSVSKFVNITLKTNPSHIDYVTGIPKIEVIGCPSGNLDDGQ